jgi:membrane protein DedA with SNARE-associated domain
MSCTRFAFLAILAAALWVGGLWVVGYLAVPVLFSAQADRQLAGMLAGEIFSRMFVLDLICAGFLLLFAQWGIRDKSGRKILLWVLLPMLVSLLAINLGLQPAMTQLKLAALPQIVMESPLAGRFGMLHGISSLLYLAESLLGLLLLWRLAHLRQG